MNEPDDQAYLDADALAAQAALRHANNTPGDDRLLALRVLRSIVDNPAAKPQDRKAAADSLLKEAALAGQATDAERQAFDMTDEQLQGVILAAQAQRGAQGSPLLVTNPAEPEAPYQPSAAFLAALEEAPLLDPLMG